MADETKISAGEQFKLLLQVHGPLALADALLVIQELAAVKSAELSHEAQAPDLAPHLANCATTDAAVWNGLAQYCRLARSVYIQTENFLVATMEWWKASAPAGETPRD